MGRVKKLYCQLHDRWFDPRKGMCPLCEMEEHDEEVFSNTDTAGEELEPLDTEFIFVQPVNIEGQILDSEDVKLYREQALKNIEEVHKRIKLFRLINTISIIIFMILLFILFML